MLKLIQTPPLGEEKETETRLNAWRVQAGAAFQAGDELAELVTDKAAFALCAEEAGRVTRLLAAEGSRVSEGQALLEIETA